MSAFDDAVAALYRAPFPEFVAERKRLAAELKAAGNKEEAARASKLARPSVSAWAVNQLWWHQRSAFEALIAAAQQVKVGDREASRQHREALARLREHAVRLLQEGGNAATEQTLRRVTTTLAALAATSSFAPDPPGALTTDRDPPGFEALAFDGGARPAPPAPQPDEARRDEHERAKREAEAKRRRAEEEAKQRRLAERERLSVKLREANALREAQQAELNRLRRELDSAEQKLRDTQALLGEIAAELSALNP